MDPFQDLLVTVAEGEGSSNVSVVSLETLTTGAPHRRAACPKLEIAGGAGVGHCEIDMSDDILSVVVAGGIHFTYRVSIWNWCTGQELFHAEHWLKSQILLSPGLSLQLNFRKDLRIYDVQREKTVATLEFPLAHVSRYLNLWFSSQCDLPSYYQLPHNANRGWLPSSSFDTFAIFVEPQIAFGAERSWVAVSKQHLLRVLNSFLQHHHEGDKVMEIPWNSWSSSARLLTGILPHSCCLSGTRFAFLIGPHAYEEIKQGLWTGVREIGRYRGTLAGVLTDDFRMVLLDFNPYELRRQQEKGLQETDTTIHYTVERITRGYTPNASGGIESALPFRLTCLKEPVDYDGVQIDFENLVGIKSLPSGKTRLDIRSF